MFHLIGKLKDYLTGNYIQILSFHDIGQKIDKHSLTIKEFNDKIEWLLKNNYHIIPLQEALAMLDTKIEKKCVVLTFDDGFCNFLDAMKILNIYNIKVTIFIVPNMVGKTSTWSKVKNIPLMNWEQIGLVTKSGHEIGSHGLYHRNLHSLSLDSMIQEIEISKIKIEQTLNIHVKSFSYPWGLYNREAIEIVQQAGYTCALTTSGDKNYTNTNKFILQKKEGGI